MSMTLKWLTQLSPSSSSPCLTTQQLQMLQNTLSMCVLWFGFSSDLFFIIFTFDLIRMFQASHARRRALQCTIYTLYRVQ